MHPNTPLLDRFMPQPDVRERFETIVAAPADLVFDVASNFDMQSLPLVQAIFWLRERVMRSSQHVPRRQQGILEETRALGWGLLSEAPGRHVVCGARCQPWQANVSFTAIEPSEFASYAEPGEVKIAWTLEATELGPARTRLIHETRAVATDEPARTRFRQYWRWARCGIVMIRLLMLPAIKRTAQRRWAADQA
jgi:hypothetical protein